MIDCMLCMLAPSKDDFDLCQAYPRLFIFFMSNLSFHSKFPAQGCDLFRQLCLCFPQLPELLFFLEPLDLLLQLSNPRLALLDLVDNLLAWMPLL